MSSFPGRAPKWISECVNTPAPLQLRRELQHNFEIRETCCLNPGIGVVTSPDCRRPLESGLPQSLVQGSEVTPGFTALAKLKPFVASQLIDHVMAPRIEGQVVGGTKLLQL